MLPIKISTIRHRIQRYATVGDWLVTSAKILIRVSVMSDWRYEFLVGFHELIEMGLCLHRGIRQEDVDFFDTEWLKKKKSNKYDEPGDDPKAPYHKEHVFAESLERLLAQQLGVEWDEYEKVVNSL